MTITDHALVRYLERVEGVDVESIRRYLLTENVRVAASMTDATGARSTVVHPDGFRLVLQGGKVVTCMGLAKRGQDKAALTKRARRKANERADQEPD